MHSVIKKINSRQLVILSGACGTEIQRRGVPTPLPLWSTVALLTHPDVVQQIHEDYIRAGAEVVTANTFRTNVRALKKAELEGRAQELTNCAVDLALRARSAAERDVLVAGSQGPVEDCYAPELVPSDEELEEEHSTHARWLKEAGVDFIMIETINSIREARHAAAAVRSTRLPFSVSFVCNASGTLLSGDSLRDAVEAVVRLGSLAVFLNCMPAGLITKVLPKLAVATALPFGAYGQGEGEPADHTGWQFTDSCTSATYVDFARQWQKTGATLIGGCCGTTPEYIRLLSNAFRLE